MMGSEKDGKVILQVGCHQCLETSCISIDDDIAKVQKRFTNGCLHVVYYPFLPFRLYFCVWNSEERFRLLIDERESNGLVQSRTKDPFFAKVCTVR